MIIGAADGWFSADSDSPKNVTPKAAFGSIIMERSL